jgi:hypothetical protein
MLLGQLIRKLFPERQLAPMPEAMAILSEASGLVRELTKAGFGDAQIAEVTQDFELDMALLDDLDTLFGPSADWTTLSDAEKTIVVAEIRQLAGHQPQLLIPSTALIAVARR